MARTTLAAGLLFCAAVNVAGVPAVAAELVLKDDDRSSPITFTFQYDDASWSASAVGKQLMVSFRCKQSVAGCSPDLRVLVVERPGLHSCRMIDIRPDSTPEGILFGVERAFRIEFTDKDGKPAREKPTLRFTGELGKVKAFGRQSSSRDVIVTQTDGTSDFFRVIEHSESCDHEVVLVTAGAPLNAEQNALVEQLIGGKTFRRMDKKQ